MKFLRYLLLGLLIVVVIVVVGGFIIYNNWTSGPIPQHEGEITVTGLSDSVEILRDPYGVPYIYASNSYDLFFAQGYTQAQDRWWQMEFARATGDGRLQELTGQTSSLMGTDIFIRSVGWRRAAENDVASADPQTLTELQAFADGVNAYITSRPAGQLALEYNVLGITGVTIPIREWTPVDSIVWGKVMAWDLSGNQSAERFLSRLVDALGEDMAEAYRTDWPFGEKPTIIQPEDLPEPGETFSQRVASIPELQGLVGISTELAGGFDDSEGFFFGRGEGIGSNNWVVSGDRTDTGMPLLADDPHLGIQMPSIWYEVGLHCQPVSEECPYNVRGFALPAAPGVIIGHNDQIAWGVTNVGWDTQDLYRITVNPDNPLQYEWDGEWRDMTVHEEVIRFGDSDETLTIEVRETHLGPIINDHQRDDEGNLMGFNNEDPLALRWTATAERGTIFESVLRLNRAQNWDEFRAALEYWDTPSQNVVYADVEGNIGYQTPGRVPVRAPGHNGLLPVDGNTSENEWLGYVPFDALPSVLNPERGYIATANQALVPFEYYEQLRDLLADEFGEDAHYAFGYQWADGYRGERIVELLEATETHSIASFQELHADNKQIFAEELAPFLAEIEFDDETLSEARDWMLEWDYHMAEDSPQAALFAHFWVELLDATWDDELAQIDDSGGGALATVQLAADPENSWWDDVTTGETETRDDIFHEAFAAAYSAAVERMGEDRSAWAWGDLHTATFTSNPLGASGIDLIEDMVNRGPVPSGGSSSTVNATSWNTDGGDFSVRALPSMRMIIDLSNLDNSVTMHTTGQSGHPFSDQYGNLIEDWADVEYKPMLFTREAVEAAGAQRLVLQPGE